MPSFSTTSLSHLRECHPDLQRLFARVVLTHDCAVIDGHRSEREQNKAFHAGRSKLRFPQSRHNLQPAMAVDVVPFPIPDDWGATDPLELARFYFFAGFVKATAHEMGIKATGTATASSATRISTTYHTSN